VVFHICFGQFDTDSEYTYSQDDTRDFERNGLQRFGVDELGLGMNPTAWIEDICTVRTHDDTEEEGPTCFTDVELNEWDTSELGMRGTRAGLLYLFS